VAEEVAPEQNAEVPAAAAETEAAPAPAAGQPAPKQSRSLVVVFAVIVLVVIGFVGFQFRARGEGDPYTGSKYVVLYKNLDLTDAAAVVEGLRQEGVKDFKLEDEGRTILVPRKQKADISIAMAQAGVQPSGGVIGYEIFDKGGALGATDFDKRIKFTRALNGELSRNISRIYGVEEARVAIVLPEKQMFTTEKNPVTSAIFVKIMEGYLLTPEQVQGIISLVSSSVEDLDKENITVVDYHGRVLSDPAYERDYDKLAALLQAQRVDTVASKTSLFGIGRKDGVSLQKSSSVATAYKVLDKSNREKKEKELRQFFNFNKKMSAKDLMEMKLKFKTKYEDLMESKIIAVIEQFLPPKSTEVKVNLELTNLQEIPEDINSMLAKVSTIILLDENNKEVVLTPEIKEAMFKAIAAVTGYVRGRDTIDLRWAPMLTLYRKAKGLDDRKGFLNYGKKVGGFVSGTVGKVKGNEELMKKINVGYVYYGVGFFVLLLVFLSFKKRKSAGGGELETSIFDEEREGEGMDDLAEGPSIAQVRDAVSKAPEKVANVLERWFSEEGGSE